MQVMLSKLVYPYRRKLGKNGVVLRRHLSPLRGHHLRPNVSTDDFIATLNERGFDYAVLPTGLAWTNQLEVLVSDDHIKQVDQLLTRWPVGVPVGVFSETGGSGYGYHPPQHPGHSFYRMALFPPHISEQLLGRTIVRPDGTRALASREAFLSLAFRAAYLETDCWQRNEDDSRWQACPRCDSELRQLSNGTRLPEIVTPEFLDGLLKSEGWGPSVDLLEKSAHWMPWISDRLPTLDQGGAEDEPGVSVFFLRQRGVDSGYKGAIMDALRSKGFEPLLEVDLDPDHQALATRSFRGGNWGATVFPVSGGPPATIVVALDLSPILPDEKQRLRQPACDNQNIVRAKLAVRDFVNSEIPPDKRYSAIHSSDNSDQSWRAVQTLFPEREEELRAKVAQLRKEFATEGVIRNLTRPGSRAKVELIDWNGTPAVRKTFLPRFREAMEREAEIIGKLAPLCPEMPRLLSHGDDHLIENHAGNTPPFPDWPHVLPIGTVRQLARFIRTAIGQGIDPVALKPGVNVILTSGGLRIVELDGWADCDPAMLPEKSRCLGGKVRDESGDRAGAGLKLENPYWSQWYRYTGLPVRSFLYDPVLLQILRRSVHLTKRYTIWATRSSVSFVVRRALKLITRSPPLST